MIVILFYGDVCASILSSGSGLIIVSPSTITVPGSYRLGNDINGQIIIDADNVILDLNGRIISNPGNTAIYYE